MLYYHYIYQVQKDKTAFFHILYITQTTVYLHMQHSVEYSKSQFLEEPAILSSLVPVTAATHSTCKNAT